MSIVIVISVDLGKIRSEGLRKFGKRYLKIYLCLSEFIRKRHIREIKFLAFIFQYKSFKHSTRVSQIYFERRYLNIFFLLFM